MRKLLTIGCMLGSIAAAAAQVRDETVLDNARVHIFKHRYTGPDLGLHPGPYVAVQIETEYAFWGEDPPSEKAPRALPFGATWVIVEPRGGAAPPAPPTATPPGGAQFTGMSFKPIFENDKVRAIRARMDIGAREAFHTHASDTVVVHLSGGEIEDTADGKMVVNRWKPGDVEFEAKGSSHSARNLGKPIDVVLVALK
jgi:quercetin dioxygenase-like cupin family protein